MRVNFTGQLAGNSSGLNEGVVTTVTSPLYLQADPTNALEASTKRYIDNSFLALNASNIKTGVISANRLPAFTGDLTSPTGSGNFVLSSTGVAAGTYTKATVNSKGRIVGASLLTNDNIPVFSWSKIASGKPTTLGDYGITDGISKTGGLLDGIINVTQAPTVALHAANKQYTDLVINSGTNLSVGDFVVRPSSVTPSGFLRCNGAELSKTIYAALYAVIGDTYNNNLAIGGGKPWQRQYGFNSQQSADITGWTTGTSLPATFYSSQAIVTKSRVYLLGGGINSVLSNSVYTAPINADGTLGAWTIGTSLPGIVAFAEAIVTKNRVHLLSSTVADVYPSYKVYTAPINANGTLGTWTTGTSLPGTFYYSQAIVTKSRVYLLGGIVKNIKSSSVYTALINADGTLGTWSVTAISLPGPLYGSQAVVTKNRVYLLGGENEIGLGLAIVYTAPINADGTLGAWTTGTSLPSVASFSQAIVTNNRVYLLGGDNESGVSLQVYTAPINADGTLGTWVTGTSLPAKNRDSQAIITKSRVYLLGGYTTNGPSSIVYTAPFAGGSNDYSMYYDGTIMPTDPSNFKLPDLTLSETTSAYYFVKT